MPHIHEQIDFTVEVFVVNENAVLLRKHDKYKIWLGVGGHVELNEDPNEAAIREVREETGLEIELVDKKQNYSNKYDGYKELISPEFLNRHKINDSHDHVTLVYFATSANRNLIQGIKEVSDECRWFTENELSDPENEIRDNIKLYSKNAIIKSRS